MSLFNITYFIHPASNSDKTNFCSLLATANFKVTNVFYSTKRKGRNLTMFSKT